MKVSDIDKRIAQINEHVRQLDRIKTGLPPAEFLEFERKIGAHRLDDVIDGSVSLLREYMVLLSNARDNADVSVG